jgi:hypothetical protein
MAMHYSWITMDGLYGTWLLLPLLDGQLRCQYMGMACHQAGTSLTGTSLVDSYSIHVVAQQTMQWMDPRICWPYCKHREWPRVIAATQLTCACPALLHVFILQLHAGFAAACTIIAPAAVTHYNTASAVRWWRECNRLC